MRMMKPWEGLNFKKMCMMKPWEGLNFLRDAYDEAMGRTKL